MAEEKPLEEQVLNRVELNVATEDSVEGRRSFVERRRPEFKDF